MELKKNFYPNSRKLHFDNQYIPRDTTVHLCYHCISKLLTCEIQCTQNCDMKFSFVVEERVCVSAYLMRFETFQINFGVEINTIGYKRRWKLRKRLKPQQWRSWVLPLEWVLLKTFFVPKQITHSRTAPISALNIPGF